MSQNPKQNQAASADGTPLSLPPTPPSAPSAPSSESGPARRLGKVTELPPFRVVLHDDEHVEMAYVVRSIVELTPLSAPFARDVMLNAHEHGHCPMLVTHQERAELYQEQFALKGLTVSIQAA